MLAKIANVLVVRKELPATTLQGADRLRQGQSRQALLRLAGRRLDRASVGGAARSAGRHQDGARALSRRAAGAHRRGRRPRRHVLRHARDLGAALSRRQGEAPRRRRPAARRARRRNVPTFSEAGVPGFQSITWFGLVAPPGTPAALAERINRDTVEILKQRGGRRHACASSRSRPAPPRPPTPPSSSPTKPRSGAR